MALEVKIHARNGVLPAHASQGAAGLDLRADSLQRATEYYAGEADTIGTGVHVAIPAGHVGLLFLRSSLAKRGFRLANGVGVIDSDYRGEIKVALYYSPQGMQPGTIAPGERIAQLVVLPCPALEVIGEPDIDALGSTVRGDGGFGSTGRGVPDLSPGADARPGQVGLFNTKEGA